MNAQEFMEKVAILVQYADKLGLNLELEASFEWQSGINKETGQVIKEPRFVQSAKIYSKK